MFASAAAEAAVAVCASARGRLACRRVRAERRTLLSLTVATVLLSGLQAVTGIADLVLYAAPLLLIVGFLLSGRYVGEDRILALRQAAPRRRTVEPRRHWSHARDRALSSLLERSPRLLRGPPAPVAA
jgi:heme A synthase